MDVTVPIKFYIPIKEMETEIGFEFITLHKNNYVFKKNDYYIYLSIKLLDDVSTYSFDFSNIEILGQMVHSSEEDVFMKPPSFYEQVINGIWSSKIKWRTE